MPDLRLGGVEWRIPSVPYRAACLNELERRFAALDSEAASRVADLSSASALLGGPSNWSETRTNAKG